MRTTITMKTWTIKSVDMCGLSSLSCAFNVHGRLIHADGNHVRFLTWQSGSVQRLSGSLLP